MHSEDVLQIVIGARQALDPVAVKEAGPVASSDFEKVPQGRAIHGRPPCGACQCSEQPAQAPPNLGRAFLGWVFEKGSHAVDPCVGPSQKGPVGRGRAQTALQDPVQPLQFWDRAPLFIARPILEAISHRR